MAVKNTKSKVICKKSPAGRKPIEDKKVTINLFIRQNKFSILIKIYI